jgi:hypothetical protein
MADQATRSRERDEGRQIGRKPRDVAHWARYVETLEGTAGSNVGGRRVVGPLQGFGKMWQKTYSAFGDENGTTVAQVQSLARQRPDLRARLLRGRRD